MPFRRITDDIGTEGDRARLSQDSHDDYRHPAEEVGTHDNSHSNRGLGFPFAGHGASYPPGGLF